MLSLVWFGFSPEPGPFPGIIDLFGVGGGLLEYRASLLAGKGFAVMALAYYNYDDLPKTMETMRIEYFEEAVNYLRGHPEVRSPQVSLAPHQSSSSYACLGGPGQCGSPSLSGRQSL